MTDEEQKKATDATTPKDAVAEIRLFYSNHSVGFSAPAKRGIPKALWKQANEYIWERNEPVLLDTVEPKNSCRGNWTDMFEGGRRVTMYMWQPEPKGGTDEEHVQPEPDRDK